jgi:hypothetical protein
MKRGIRTARATTIDPETGQNPGPKRLHGGQPSAFASHKLGGNGSRLLVDAQTCREARAPAATSTTANGGCAPRPARTLLIKRKPLPFQTGSSGWKR